MNAKSTQEVRFKGTTQEVRLFGNVIEKTFLQNIGLEYEKHQKLYQISLGNNFTVPKAISIDKDSSTIQYEYVSELRSIKSYFFEYTNWKAPSGSVLNKIEEMYFLAGSILATIHKKLSMTKTARWPVSRQFLTEFSRYFPQIDLLDDSPEAVLHGDYGFSNVCWTEADPHHIVVIDPSPNYYSSFNCNEKASIYLDIAKFTLCLKGQVPIKYYPMINWKKSEVLKNMFLRGYESTSGTLVKRDLLNATEKAIFAMKLTKERESTTIRRAAYIAMFGLTEGLQLGKINYDV